jgi:hypothetical protein
MKFAGYDHRVATEVPASAQKSENNVGIRAIVADDTLCTMVTVIVHALAYGSRRD